MSLAPENLGTVWAELLVGALCDAGVTDVVVSPGSRSTPFVLAAAADTRLTLHDAIDERAAAFFALGQARVTGRPSLLLCTSGTAGAHYLPAVIEADAAHVPLVVLTADRPPELHGCGAAQTIAQPPLFSGYARRVVDLGAPDASAAALRGLRRAAAQAVFATRWPTPGPVHLNAPARKPLEPVPVTTAAGEELARLAAGIATEPPVRPVAPRLAPDPAAIDELARLCLRARRGLVVAGPAPVAQAGARAAVAALARATGFPVAAEATSQLRFVDPPDGAHGAAPPRVDALDWLAADPRFARDRAPDLILQLGAAPISSAWERFVAARPDVARAVITADGWPDPTSSARLLVVAPVADACAALAAAVTRARAGRALEPSAYAAALVAADAAVWRAVDADLDGAAATLEEGAVARLVTAALPEGSLLVVGNSLPVRHLDAYCPGPLAAVDVLSQRGASGIDGLIAGAAGAASVARRPVTLLLGDVSFLHDLGGLALAARAPVPLAIVVIHNDGGRIFEQLPIVKAGRAAALPHFTTPHGRELEHAAALFEVRHRRVHGRDQLAAALGEAHAQAGASIIECMVPPHGAAAQRARIATQLERTLSALGAAR